ncbi:hypothetical protein [Mycobacteroides abscessus]|uniref:hypothetical protein n=1 Tax=Mycobacteroides abscessus TaxID=36809 RepID=UPI000C269B50|nr:hypothetical protein [Mycobacteroides abscessus]AWG62950.1 hypothetical protein DDT46_03445 [Mycobacteroides abscessus]PVA29551.1 hypothetical protein DDJ88_13885 [Mycobacteroides abscessus]PVA43457.1 hypothetical protein DDJ35_22715 [Mycobacteroides abscessus]PVA73591.1 hypothetical protein DDJ37_14300 [Mycobacteroides abscessus]PVB12070.1 hypothetical protein DDJ40_17090 [Mycobacteroides abscessus]
MTDRWPLLVAEPIEGEQLVSSQLRPRAAAVAIDRSDYPSACDHVRDLCGTWGGAGMPLIPVSPLEDIDPRWSRILNESNIDGVERSDLLGDDAVSEYTDLEGPSTAELIRIVVDLERKPTVQTVRGMAQEDPWHLAYLAVLGDLSSQPHPQNTWNDLRHDLTFDDVLTIRGVAETGSAARLLALARDFTAMSAVELSRSKLPTGLQGGYNRGFPSSSRFEWSDDVISQQFGPNIVVVYEPGSPEDLALIWNLRARFLHPQRFPLAVPMTPTIEDDIRYFIQANAAHYFGFGHNLALTSMSVAPDRVAALATSVRFDAVDPWQLLRPIGGYCSASTQVVRFTGGKARTASFSPSDFQAIGGGYLGSHQGTWMKRKTVVVDAPLPPSRTMRRQIYYGDSHYLDGPITSGGQSDGFTTILMPSGLEVLSALAVDHGLRLTESAPGKAAEHLMRVAGRNLSMFAAPGVVELLSELTRGRSVGIVKRRLNQFLAEPEPDESSDRYQVLLERLDRGLGSPDAEELSYPTFDRTRQLLRMRRDAAQQWVRWAMAAGLVLRGVEANCTRCGHKQWRPLSEAIPSLVCHACGCTIDSPHGYNHIDYRYRASELLLRAMGHDVLSHVLAMRYVCNELGGRSLVFGGYPGVEFRKPDDDRVEAEADVIVVLRNGEIVLGECKANARGLTPEELDKLWSAADQLGARATFAATLDRAANCGDEWRVTEGPTGRPHFALTAEHLFELQGGVGASHEDLFAWRADYLPRFDSNRQEVTGLELERRIDEEFDAYVERTAKDYEQHTRAPWTRGPHD